MFRIKHLSKFRAVCCFVVASICFALIGAVVLPKQKAEAQGQRREKKKYQPAPHTPTNQTVYAPLIDLPGQTEAEIVINNRSSHDMEITPTFYATLGQAFAASPMMLKPAEVRYFAIADLLPSGLNRNQVGGVSLSYQGSMMEVAAQLTLLGKKQSGNADITLYGAMDYRSTTQEAVWWMPSKGTATMILGNSSNTPISASLKFANGETKEIKLDPYATEVVTRRDAGRPREVAPDSVRIEVAGPVGSLRAAGFVAALDGRILTNIRYYDPQNARQPHLFATRLNVKGNLLHMVLKNTGAVAITARPRFLPVNGDSNAAVELPPIAINPHQAVEVNLKPLLSVASARDDLDVVSVQVTNDGANGSLIGALCGINLTKKNVYDTPLRDSGPLRNSTGSYPWRLDNDYSTVISITNIGSEPAGFTATIKHESGKYMPQARILAVGETATFDLNKIRDEQIPDKDGNTLPKTAKMGQVHWSVLRGGDTVRLIGRGEMTSASRQVSSSYSCPVCCPDSFAELVASPNSPVILQNGFASVYVDGIWLDCYNNTVGPYWYPYGASWWCEDPAIVSFTGAGDHYNANGLAPGYTLTEASTIDYYYYDDGMDCYSQAQPYTDPGDAQVKPTITGGSTLWWFNGSSVSGFPTSIDLTASGTGTINRTWQITAGSDKVVFSNNMSSITTAVNPITIFSKNRSINADDISVTVSWNGQTSNAKTLSVKVVYKLVEPLTNAITDNPDARGYLTTVSYDIRDNFDEALSGNMPMNESFTTAPMSDITNNWPLSNPNGTTIPQGMGIADEMSGPPNPSQYTPLAINPCQPTLCSTKVVHRGQEFKAGSTSIGLGYRVQSNTQQYYTDHGRHNNRISPSPPSP